MNAAAVLLKCHGVHRKVGFYSVPMLNVLAVHCGVHDPVLSNLVGDKLKGLGSAAVISCISGLSQAALLSL